MIKIYEDLIQFTEVLPVVNLACHQYLLTTKEPILFHTGTAAYAKELIPQIKKVLKNKKLKYIYISHFESDECGGLFQLLNEFPEAIPVCSEITARQLIGFGITSNFIQKLPGETLKNDEYELEFIEYPSEVHLWNGFIAFEKKRKIFFSSDLVFTFGNFHGEIRESNWEKEVNNSGALDISQKLVDDLLKINPKFLATGHGPCVKILE
ncbi:MAG: hypothetical protein JXM74_04905 [Fusobacteriaceae bacterium]|nr:hypothetical protein [Fusobacteriaceae bacterium]MBN2838074.1 hypothetical protein [Fusobacteriaceae bacterium]